MTRNERGFTLIEMLLVLMIFSIVTMIAISFSYRYVKINEYEQAIEQLRLTMHLAQLTAQQEEATSYVRILEGNTILLTALYTEHELKWKLPEGMRVYFQTNNKRIRFNSSGNISEIGHLEIKMPEKTRNYSINLSKGRLRLIE